MTRPVAIALAVAIVGCGEPSANQSPADASIDAGPPAPCWPDTLGTPKGAAILGTGRDAFEAMPDVLPLEFGSQDGFNLVAHVRMTGIEPGNPKSILDPANPRTRVRAFFADTNVPLNAFARCPFRNGYVPAAEGGFELAEGLPVIFETCWRSEHLFGKRIRIELELLDDRGGYATDVKIVTAAPPTQAGYPSDEGTPGCVHLGDT